MSKQPIEFSLKSLLELYAGNQEYVQQTVEVFVEQIRTDSEKLNVAYLSKNKLELAAVSHKMKTGFKLFESKATAENLEELEFQAKNEGDWSRMTDLIDKILVASKTLETQLKSIDYSTTIMN